MSGESNVNAAKTAINTSSAAAAVAEPKSSANTAAAVVTSTKDATAKHTQDANIDAVCVQLQRIADSVDLLVMAILASTHMQVGSTVASNFSPIIKQTLVEFLDKAQATQTKG